MRLLRFWSNLKTYDWKCLYRYHIAILLINLPFIFIPLILNLSRVNYSLSTIIYIPSVIVGYYFLALLAAMSVVWLVFFPLKRTCVVLIGLINAIFLFYQVINSLAYSITKLHIDFFWLEWIINDFEAFGLPTSTIVSIILLFIVILIFEYFVLYFAQRLIKIKFLISIIVGATLIAFSTGQVIHVVAYNENYTPVTSLTPQFPIYIPITSHKSAGKLGDLMPGMEDQTDSDQNSGAFYYPKREIVCHPPDTDQLPNILFILYESWRYDMMTEKITPNTYALAEKSSVFNKHFCSGNSTVAGTIGLFYSIHPTYWTSIKANSAAIDNPVFIDQLKMHNYDFGIYAKSNFERHRIKTTVFSGIDVYENFAGKTKIEQDADMTAQVNEYLADRAENNERFFAMAFYKSNHYPYNYLPEDSVFLPARNLNMMNTDDNTDPTEYFNDAKNATHYVDRLVGRLLENLDTLGLMDNTIIVVTTDHAEEFNDNRRNFWGHGSNFTKYQTISPFVVYFPDREPTSIDYPTSHIDFVPTVMTDYFGCENDIGDYSNGRNLFDEPDGVRPLVIGSYVNHAFVIEDNVYEIFPIYTKKYKLDNISEPADPPSPVILKQIMDEINRFYSE